MALSALVLAPGARSQQFFTIPQPPASPKAETIAGDGQQAQQTGSISGKVVDQSGAEIPGAIVKLIRQGQSPDEEAKTDDYGLFAFTHVSPGAFQLSISSPGLSPQQFSDDLQPGQAFVTPIIMLTIPTQVTEVRVEMTQEEIAEVQIKQQVQQRLFGIIPNFYATYDPNPVPLPAKLKLQLAWKSATDPLTIVGIAMFAGFDQAGDRWGAYGQGAEGYGKRFGATYANVFSATFIGSGVMASVLKQDPRYFYKGTGTMRSRWVRALSSSVICKGDNGNWQPNYSNVIGSFAGAGLEYTYVPAHDRRPAGGFVVSNALLRLGETSLAGVLQEFIFPKFRPNHATQSHP
jgi:Carboxypeptidase regulatory-like domain